MRTPCLLNNQKKIENTTMNTRIKKEATLKAIDQATLLGAKLYDEVDGWEESRLYVGSDGVRFYTYEAWNLALCSEYPPTCRALACFTDDIDREWMEGADLTAEGAILLAQL